MAFCILFLLYYQLLFQDVKLLEYLLLILTYVHSFENRFNNFCLGLSPEPEIIFKLTGAVVAHTYIEFVSKIAPVFVVI